VADSPYEQVVELARLEHEAVAEGDWQRVQALQLEEAARLNQAVLDAIRSAIDGVQGELVKLSRERDAAAGYAATGYAAAGAQKSRLAWQG
jgi:hypothetical protein